MKKVVISGGGTGGHIFPAISIANAVKERYPQAEILFVGAENRMEMERVPNAGYPIVGLPVAGFDRKNLFRNIGVIVKLISSMLLARKVLRNFRPDMAVGVGGYASGPTLKAANRMGIPTLIQEQNSTAGVTNKLLAQKATKICVAYTGMERFFPKDKIVLTGNPVRQDLQSAKDKREEATRFFNLERNKKTILVLGGSLGARTVNQCIIHGLPAINTCEVQFIWQSGKHYYQESAEHLKAFPEAPVCLMEFISRMDMAYAAADLIISRAGAGSISEFCLLGKPVILVPSPNVAEDHQTKNAQALVQNNAAILITDKEAESILVDTALRIIHDETRLKALSVGISKMALPDAANKIVDEMEKMIRKK